MLNYGGTWVLISVCSLPCHKTDVEVCNDYHQIIYSAWDSDKHTEITNNIYKIIIMRYYNTILNSYSKDERLIVHNNTKDRNIYMIIKACLQNHGLYNFLQGGKGRHKYQTSTSIVWAATSQMARFRSGFKHGGNNFWQEENHGDTVGYNQKTHSQHNVGHEIIVAENQWYSDQSCHH